MPDEKSSTKEDYKEAAKTVEEKTDKLKQLMQESAELEALLKQTTDPAKRTALEKDIEQKDDEIQKVSKDLGHDIGKYQEEAADYKNEAVMGAITSGIKGGLLGAIIGAAFAIAAAVHHGKKNKERSELTSAANEIKNTGAAYRDALNKHPSNSAEVKAAHDAFKQAQQNFQNHLDPSRAAAQTPTSGAAGGAQPPTQGGGAAGATPPPPPQPAGTGHGTTTPQPTTPTAQQATDIGAAHNHAKNARDHANQASKCAQDANEALNKAERTRDEAHTDGNPNLSELIQAANQAKHYKDAAVKAADIAEQEARAAEAQAHLAAINPADAATHCQNAQACATRAQTSSGEANFAKEAAESYAEEPIIARSAAAAAAGSTPEELAAELQAAEKEYNEAIAAFIAADEALDDAEAAHESAGLKDKVNITGPKLKTAEKAYEEASQRRDTASEKFEAATLRAGPQDGMQQAVGNGGTPASAPAPSSRAKPLPAAGSGGAMPPQGQRAVDPTKQAQDGPGNPAAPGTKQDVTRGTPKPTRGGDDDNGG